MGRKLAIEPFRPWAHEFATESAISASFRVFECKNKLFGGPECFRRGHHQKRDGVMSRFQLAAALRGYKTLAERRPHT